MIASTSERESLSFTAHQRRSEDQRSESSGERSPAHTVCHARQLVISHQQNADESNRKLRRRTSTIQKQPPTKVLRRICSRHALPIIHLNRANQALLRMKSGGMCTLEVGGEE